MYFGAHLQANGMCMKSFTLMSYRSTRLLETISYSSQTVHHLIPAIWQGTVCKPIISILSRLAIQILLSTPFKHLWLGYSRLEYVICIPSQLPHYPNWKAGWSRVAVTIQDIDLQYIIKIVFMRIVIFNKVGEFWWPSFFSQSIFYRLGV